MTPLVGVAAAPWLAAAPLAGVAPPPLPAVYCAPLVRMLAACGLPPLAVAALLAALLTLAGVAAAGEGGPSATADESSEPAGRCEWASWGGGTAAGAAPAWLVPRAD